MDRTTQTLPGTERCRCANCGAHATCTAGRVVVTEGSCSVCGSANLIRLTPSD